LKERASLPPTMELAAGAFNTSEETVEKPPSNDVRRS
jgi:hypothetical protein